MLDSCLILGFRLLNLLDASADVAPNGQPRLERALNLSPSQLLLMAVSMASDFARELHQS